APGPGEGGAWCRPAAALRPKVTWGGLGPRRKVVGGEYAAASCLVGRGGGRKGLPPRPPVLAGPPRKGRPRAGPMPLSRSAPPASLGGLAPRPRSAPPRRRRPRAPVSPPARWAGCAAPGRARRPAPRGPGGPGGLVRMIYLLVHIAIDESLRAHQRFSRGIPLFFRNMG